MELNGSQLDVFISIKPNIRNHYFVQLSLLICAVTQVLGCIHIFSIRCFLSVWKLCRWEDLRYKRKPGRESRTIERRKNKQNGKEGSLTNRMGTSSTCRTARLAAALLPAAALLLAAALPQPQLHGLQLQVRRWRQTARTLQQLPGQP